MANDLTAVVMAGGLGTRMKSATPKHLHLLLGRRMVDWVVGAARDAGVQRVIVVASPDSADSYEGAHELRGQRGNVPVEDPPAAPPPERGGRETAQRQESN